MNTLIVTSGRKKGSCSFIAEKLLMQIKNAEIIELSNFNISFCDGCLTCDESGRCHYGDDMLNILEKVKQAQNLIFITPVRWNLLSGNLKVFLDRLNPFAVPELLSGKRAAIIAVGQTSVEKSYSIASAIESVANFCESANIQIIYRYGIGDCLTRNDTIAHQSEIEENIKKLANLLEK